MPNLKLREQLLGHRREIEGRWSHFTIAGPLDEGLLRIEARYPELQQPGDSADGTIDGGARWLYRCVRNGRRGVRWIPVVPVDDERGRKVLETVRAAATERIAIDPAELPELTAAAASNPARDTVIVAVAGSRSGGASRSARERSGARSCRALPARPRGSRA